MANQEGAGFKEAELKEFKQLIKDPCSKLSQIMLEIKLMTCLRVCVFTGNPSQHSGLVHAAVPEHTVAVSRSVGPCGGSDALPTRPVQVQGGPVCVYMYPYVYERLCV